MAEPPPERAFALFGYRRFFPRADLLQQRVTHYKFHIAIFWGAAKCRIPFHVATA
jgi:hypothetical protein